MNLPPHLNPPALQMSLEEAEEIKLKMQPFVEIMKRLQAAYDSFQDILFSAEEVQLMGSAFEQFMNNMPQEMLQVSSGVVLNNLLNENKTS